MSGHSPEVVPQRREVGLRSRERGRVRSEVRGWRQFWKVKTNAELRRFEVCGERLEADQNSGAYPAVFPSLHIPASPPPTFFPLNLSLSLNLNLS
jgi:hypothetical protein